MEELKTILEIQGVGINLVLGYYKRLFENLVSKTLIELITNPNDNNLIKYENNKLYIFLPISKEQQLPKLKPTESISIPVNGILRSYSFNAFVKNNNNYILMDIPAPTNFIDEWIKEFNCTREEFNWNLQLGISRGFKMINVNDDCYVFVSTIE
jgi:hypothetical protein